LSLSAATTSESATRAKSKANLLKRVRQFHLWLGTFFAPAILFFAFTGALQTFSLHEGRPGESYQPPQWIVKLAQIHKKQNMATRPPGPPRTPDRAKQAQRKDDAPAKPRQDAVSTLILKWFVFLMSLGLISTTALGIYMAFQFTRDARVIWALLAAGTILPTAILFL
jgi:hypothetical protein